MAYIRKAVDPDALRQACQVADATEIVVYDADFPDEVGQQFVEAFVEDARGGEHRFVLTDMDWRDLNHYIEQEAEVHGDTVKFVLDLGTPEVVSLTLDIENHYDGDVVTTKVETVAPPPPDEEDEEAATDWADTWIFQHTGTGRTEGDSAYFVTVTASSDPALVGREFEFGL